MLLLGGCCRQVNIIESLVVLKTCGCYCKVVAVGKYNFVSGSMVDRWL